LTIEENSVVVFEDEASLSNTATVSYQWSKKGVQPQICQPQRKRERKTIFGCVCPKMGDWISYVADSGNTKTFFCFLFLVVRQFGNKKVYMVLDNVRFHHAKRLKPILKRYSHRIELIFLPLYSPDLNPVERIWWLMRKEVTHNRWVKSMEQRVDEFEKWCANIDKQKIKKNCNLNENIY
jgi:putative transposase